MSFLSRPSVPLAYTLCPRGIPEATAGLGRVLCWACRLGLLEILWMISLFTPGFHGLGTNALSTGCYSAYLKMATPSLLTSNCPRLFWQPECVSGAKFKFRWNWVSRDACTSLLFTSLTSYIAVRMGLVGHRGEHNFVLTMCSHWPMSEKLAYGL